MVLKLCLFTLFLQVIPDAQAWYEEGWTLTAPSKVTAVEGYCVVIPCSYSFPKTFRVIKTYRGLWKKGNEGVNVAASRLNYYIHPDYQDRTQFLGEVWKHNCTWILNAVKPSDTGLYFFRVELPEYKSFSWVFQQTEIKVVSLQPPQVELTATEMVTPTGVKTDVIATCSVIHSCPLYHPTITWSHNGTELRSTRPVDDLQWWVHSTLTFSPSEEDIKRPLRCTVLYQGGLEVSSTVVIVQQMK